MGVAFGAFGTHSLEDKITSEQLEWWSTATNYLWYNGLGLLALGSHTHAAEVLLKVSRILIIGIVVFCGSLYAYSLTGYRLFGMITPIGGTMLLIAWMRASWCFAIRKNSQEREEK